MLTDAYGTPLHTTKAEARDAYIDGMTAYLEAQPGVDVAYDRAIAADPGFAMAYAAKARNAQVYARIPEARALMGQAMERAEGITGQARQHLEAFDHLIHSRVREGYALVRQHLLDYPRDALVAQTCMGVFSLIGFSGQSGREAEHLALAEMLAPHYGDDPWFLSQLAFAQMEAGQLDPALKSIDASLAARPRSGHGSHIRAHLYYEMGKTAEGLAYLTDWMKDYDRAGMMHCHNSWHCALWSVGSGDAATMWQIVDRDLLPDVTQSPGLNVLTDLSSLFYRAGLAGVEVPPERWAQLSNYAARAFPNPGLGFADIHAALAHAMAGRDEALRKIIEGAKGPVADQVAPCATAFASIAKGDWAAAESALLPVMASHERLGGSRAQRDLLELTMLHVLIRQGQAGAARRLLTMRRPMTDNKAAVQGLAA
ncbi:tetratricopeptide repeat protein [Alisedimentitalea sp. MJ-SS2]|uniref:tetratricopeptide repeat protein n=1 Tax=Aliisedimentitalea sp. MJ-SS2 TaxID=3049795 RepID=UPI0029159034|nr:tetratricopeptide repeat protein [Alisedimentitalea sp. MJ-SS2]MDU8929709.1 tetratricopeptide repeat protein [Alisedimentitalea sp. MJ-SS2]